MPLHYSQLAVELTYHHRYPTNETPSRRQLERWDQAIFDRYETLMTEIMPEFGIRRIPGNKSRVLILARLSNGDARGQVRSACAYFRHVAGLDLFP